MPVHSSGRVRPENAETIKKTAAAYAGRLKTNAGHPGAYVATLMDAELVDRLAAAGTSEQVIVKLA